MRSTFNHVSLANLIVQWRLYTVHPSIVSCIFEGKVASSSGFETVLFTEDVNGQYVVNFAPECQALRHLLSSFKLQCIQYGIFNFYLTCQTQIYVNRHMYIHYHMLNVHVDVQCIQKNFALSTLTLTPSSGIVIFSEVK